MQLFEHLSPFLYVQYREPRVLNHKKMFISNVKKLNERFLAWAYEIGYHKSGWSRETCLIKNNILQPPHENMDFWVRIIKYL